MLILHGFPLCFQVQYRNEAGVDAGGLKRDFFSILMTPLIASNLLTQGLYGHIECVICFFKCGATCIFAVSRYC